MNHFFIFLLLILKSVFLRITSMQREHFFQSRVNLQIRKTRPLNLFRYIDFNSYGIVKELRVWAVIFCVRFHWLYKNLKAGSLHSNRSFSLLLSFSHLVSRQRVIYVSRVLVTWGIWICSHVLYVAHLLSKLKDPSLCCFIPPVSYLFMFWWYLSYMVNVV